MAKYAIYSCEGFSREILPLLEKQALIADDGEDQIIFVDDDPKKIGAVVHGCRVISFDDLQSDEHRHRLVSIGIADPWVRNRLWVGARTQGLISFRSAMIRRSVLIA